MKFTLYVEPFDSAAERHITHLEADLKDGAQNPVRRILDQILSDPETIPALLKTIASTFGLGGSHRPIGDVVGHARTNAAGQVASAWMNAGGKQEPSSPDALVYERRVLQAGLGEGGILPGAVVAFLYGLPDGSCESVVHDPVLGNVNVKHLNLSAAAQAVDSSLRENGWLLLPGALDSVFASAQGGQVPAQGARVPASPQNAAPAQAAAVASKSEENEAAFLRHSALLHEGEEAFGAVLRLWTQNYGVKDAPQPDRQAALMACFSGHGRAASTYIRERGGLAGACIDSIVRLGLSPADEAVALGKHVALNMVQVGSALGIPTDTFLERSMFSRDPLTGDLPEPGTIPAVEFDRSSLPPPTGMGG